MKYLNKRLTHSIQFLHKNFYCAQNVIYTQTCALVLADLQTNCNKAVGKLTTGCVRLDCLFPGIMASLGLELLFGQYLCKIRQSRTENLYSL